MLRKLIIFGFCFFAMACSVSNNGDNGSFSEKYSYEVNGCKTGAHVFKGNSAEEVKAQICKALQDEDLNHGCAYSVRKAHYERRCLGKSLENSDHKSDEIELQF